MAFLKYANANIIRPDIHMPIWDQVRSSAQALGSAFDKREASQIVLNQYNPKDYMLSHCTIVASVDTEDGPGKLGKHLEGDFTVDRRYSDYFITPKTEQWINNNHDAWERKLLLSSFRTFIGGENYLEHLQIPAMSKGKILDAAARDIGDSIYIDILVATHRKHKPLIANIESKQLTTLSMGCTVLYTICTLCGNVAADETQICPHIRYSKGNVVHDELGRPHKIAELCGHVLDEPGSVKFIEASWVGTPAFTGAVLRDILTKEAAAKYASLHRDRIQVAFSAPTKVADPNLMAKAARLGTKVGFEFGQQTQQFGDGQAPKEEKKAPNPLDTAVNDLADYLKSKAVNKVRTELDNKSVPNDMDENDNDTLIKSASQSPQWKTIATKVGAMVGGDYAKSRKLLFGLLLHKHGGWKSIQASQTFSGRDILALSRVLDQIQGIPAIAGEGKVYRTVLAVGGFSAYQDEKSYLTACRRVLNRQPNETESASLIVKAKLFDLGT